MAILYLDFSNFWTNNFWIKATENFSIIGFFFQVSIKSIYSGMKMIALQSKYITDKLVKSKRCFDIISRVLFESTLIHQPIVEKKNHFPEQ
jgi:hypothetical protein